MVWLCKITLWPGSKVYPPGLVNSDTKLFMVQEVEMSIKKLSVGKSKDLGELQVEYL